jgi:bifunctional non-homologous end joining protein LigD
MNLNEYRRKRRFARTPEPPGKTGRMAGALRFVVQKHAASRLHYDFRLELDGVLKSWAVPKGPSLDPADKRLAVQVEDHPVDYQHFEGLIPAGNYGAGSVIVWDRGTYLAEGSESRPDCERRTREGLVRGRLTFRLDGQKLHGDFSLVRLKDGKNWLLFKRPDAHAARSDVVAQDRSVISGRTLADLARPARQQRASAPRLQSADQFDLRDAPVGAMPSRVRPMLATLADQPFDRQGWLFELKWDGYRAIAHVENGTIHLYSRTGLSFERRFAPVVQALKAVRHDVVLDGEMVVVDEAGRSGFQLLQNYQKTGQGRLVYYVFDLLHLDGHDLRPLPLRRRKQLLAAVLPVSPFVQLSEHVEDDGAALFRAAVARGVEGIVAKDAASPYLEAARGAHWVKVKARQRQEAVIAGYTEPRGSRSDLGALLLGVYERGRLVYIGHTGGRMGRRVRADLRARLEPLRRSRSPFVRVPPTNAPAHWVKPELVCEVDFQEWTEDRVMRQPVFLGLREDKPPKQVRRELPRPVQSAPEPAQPQAAPATSRRRDALPASRAGTAELTNLDKVYFPEDGFTKADLIAYYREVAPVILPYLRDRPQSLHRHPAGIDGEDFFQKDVSKRPPPAWVQTVRVSSENERHLTYVLCQDEQSLLYLANLGCIELNPWLSRTGALDRPDYLVIDLDPEGVDFLAVVEAALAVRRLLDRVGVPNCCKTSGKTGLHVYVPLAGRYGYEESRRFAELAAALVNTQLPATTSLLRKPADRQGRVYLDYLQNRRGQTLAAPYSVRPVAGASVSAPLKWSEVRRSLDPTKFNLRTMVKRLDRVGDLWAVIQGPGADLAMALDRLSDTSAVR